jgi:hypothetical protein
MESQTSKTAIDGIEFDRLEAQWIAAGMPRKRARAEVRRLRMLERERLTANLRELKRERKRSRTDYAELARGGMAPHLIEVLEESERLNARETAIYRRQLDALALDPRQARPLVRGRSRLRGHSHQHRRTRRGARPTARTDSGDGDPDPEPPSRPAPSAQAVAP